MNRRGNNAKQFEKKRSCVVMATYSFCWLNGEYESVLSIGEDTNGKPCLIFEPRCAVGLELFYSPKNFKNIVIEKSTMTLEHHSGDVGRYLTIKFGSPAALEIVRRYLEAHRNDSDTSSETASSPDTVELVIENNSDVTLETDSPPDAKESTSLNQSSEIL